MSELNRRGFLGTAAVGAAAMSLPAASYGRVLGANERIGVGFLGVGGRCQEHLRIVKKFDEEKKGAFIAAVNDVWDGNKETGRGLRFSAEKWGLNPDDNAICCRDYRKVLDNKDVDVVCIATPDHWHAKQSIDAMSAGKDVYCEKPMTRTIDESHAVVDAARKYNRVMTVGVQSMADPIWRMAYDYIKQGGIGHVAQAQTSYYRNYIGGQWRYYKLTPDMNPKTIDWDMFLGHKFDVNGVPLGPKPEQMPFDRAVYGQWRCYWPFGGGMFTDLFVHQTTHLIAAMGVRYPARVVGGGGIYLEYDERDVPDVAAVVADYDEGCQLLIMATMINDHAIEEVIRGRLGTIRFVNKKVGERETTNKEGKTVKRDIMQFGYEVLPQSMKSGPGLPRRLESQEGKFVPTPLKGNDTEALWENFLECCRSRNRETLSTAELGAAAFTTVNLGVQSYRTGQVMFWNKELRKPVEGNGSWATMWEKRSKARGKPNQIMGWQGEDAGSVVVPPEYQKLGGAWVGGKDPAGA
jgi:predicted dehydrogenase